jgi:hypothetical protein
MSYVTPKHYYIPVGIIMNSFITLIYVLIANFDVYVLMVSFLKKKNFGPKQTGQTDKQRSTKHSYKTKDRVTLIPLKTGVY